jgi:hypothetical protein
MLKLRSPATLAALSLALITEALVCQAPGTRIKIAGTYSASYARQFGVEIGDVEGHTLSIGQARGTNRSTGETAYMDGAQLRMIQTEDLIRGTGTAEGYSSLVTGADTARLKSAGRVTTVASAEKGVVISFEGSWTVEKATGKYQGRTGSGTYRGRFISPIEYVVEWEGTLSEPSATAVR